MVVVRVKDLRTAGVCPRAKAWFDRHDLDWRGFVKNGVDLELLRATGDMAETVERVGEAARKRGGD